VALPESKIPDEHLRIWGEVHTAQSVALNAAKDGVITSSVDAVARSSLQATGYAQYFTHRLGHGEFRLHSNNIVTDKGL
jgi:Xaa-Pro aminopeptidase